MGRNRRRGRQQVDKELYEIKKDQPKSMALPDTVRNLVSDFVADYGRRTREIKGDKISDEVREHFLSLNAAIDAAAEETAPAIRNILLDDIASIRGYDKSMCHCMMAKATYYRYKNELEVRIAKELKVYG